MYCIKNQSHVAMVVYNGNSLCMECFLAELKQENKAPYPFYETKEQFQQRMKEERSMQITPKRG